MTGSNSFWFANPSTGFYNGATSRSLRMQDARLTRTPSSTGNPKKWTFSAWLKRTNLGQSYIFAGSPLAGGYDGIAAIYFNGSDQLHTYYDTSGSNPYGNVSSETRVYRDLGSWYHLCWAVDAANTIHKIWINNNLVSTNTSRYPPNVNYGLNNSGDEMVIGDGSWDSYGSPNFNGYMAEINYLDGQYLEPDSFTETKNGVLIPLKDPSLTYGTNGFRLQFLATGTSADSSGIGADTSGQGNHYAVTSLAAGDVVTDNPENNFANLSVLNSDSNASISEGGLRATMGGSGNYDQVRSDFGLASGKWYWEVYVEERGYLPSIGVMAGYTGPSNNPTHWVTFGFGGWFISYNSSVPQYMVNQNASGGTNWSVTMPSNGNIISVAIDVDNNKIWWGRNGTFYNSSGTANPATGADARVTLTANQTWHPVLTLDTGASSLGYSNSKMKMNFGQDPSFANSLTGGDVGTETDENGNGLFKYAPPSGYLACCTASLPDVTIGPDSDTQADDHFNTFLYTGTNATNRNLALNTFTPDWVWLKSRSQADNHVLVDSSRVTGTHLDSSAVYPNLHTNTTDHEVSDSHPKIITNGVQVSGGLYDNNNVTFAVFNWKANGGSLTTNDASSTSIGTIDSVFQANDTSGFSIVTYTGTGSAGTVRHGLSVAPSLVIIKSRTTASPANWVIGQDQSGFTGQNYFTDISAFGTNSGSFNNTAPTSSVVSIGTDQTTNGNTATYVMYCFANVEGFSKIGSYEMNYNSDGTFVYTGFRPAWLLTRPVDQNGNWSIYDTVREPFNDGDSNMFFAGSSGGESGFAASAVDFLSNGFKLRQSSDGYSNIASNTAIYMAFAEQPFKFSNAR